MGVKFENFIKTFTTKIKEIKNYELIVTILVMAIIISIYISSLKPIDKPKDNQDDGHKSNIEEESQEDGTQEERLEKKLSAIKGAGKVEVMITYASSKEIVTAMNTTQSNVTTEEQDSGGGARKTIQSDTNNQAVTMNESDGTKPLVIKEVEPEIKGVIVIAEGAYDINVKIELLRAVQTVLGVSPNKVEVFVMDENHGKE